jgi:hypothetical protein
MVLGGVFCSVMGLTSAFGLKNEYSIILGVDWFKGCLVLRGFFSKSHKALFEYW